VWADFIRDDVKKVVTDNVTKLMWQDDNRTIGDANKKTWENAITFCENLDFAGYTNWHLPNFNELYSIADRSKYNPAMSSVFINVVSSLYWSATTYASNTSNAWDVYFSNGSDDYNRKTGTYYVRCVRPAD
jgi:hypothetical protein